jgi:hypothetical protein
VSEGNTCMDSTFCVACNSSQILDLTSAMCVDVCPLDTDVVFRNSHSTEIGAFRYCRGNINLIIEFSKKNIRGSRL